VKRALTMVGKALRRSLYSDSDSTVLGADSVNRAHEPFGGAASLLPDAVLAADLAQSHIVAARRGRRLGGRGTALASHANKDEADCRNRDGHTDHCANDRRRRRRRGGSGVGHGRAAVGDDLSGLRACGCRHCAQADEMRRHQPGEADPPSTVRVVTVVPDAVPVQAASTSGLRMAVSCE
jgi:hypothetical protein